MIASAHDVEARATADLTESLALLGDAATVKIEAERRIGASLRRLRLSVGTARAIDIARRLQIPNDLILSAEIAARTLPTLGLGGGVLA